MALGEANRPFLLLFVLMPEGSLSGLTVLGWLHEQFLSLHGPGIPDVDFPRV